MNDINGYIIHYSFSIFLKPFVQYAFEIHTLMSIAHISTRRIHTMESWWYWLGDSFCLLAWRYSTSIHPSFSLPFTPALHCVYLSCYLRPLRHRLARLSRQYHQRSSLIRSPCICSRLEATNLRINQTFARHKFPLMIKFLL